MTWAQSSLAQSPAKLYSDRGDVAPLDTIPIVGVGPIDQAAVNAEDFVAEQNHMPQRIAIPFEVAISPTTDGQWETLPDNMQLWRLRIDAAGARHINLGFAQYHMPKGGELVIFAEDRSEIVRPFTSADNHDHGQLWTPLVRSEAIVIEVRLPAGIGTNELQLELAQIGYGYRGFGTDPVVLAAPRSGSCNVDVNCSQGDAWANEIPSVGVYTLNGFFTCTGAMVNNTAQNQTPYFLTADHCGINSSNDATIVVYWNYENSTCRTPGSGASGSGGNGSLSQFTSGSTFRADYSPSDFNLVQLSSSPNPAWGVTFSGWDRSTGNSSSAVCIHHPNTEEKRISFENNAVTTTSYGGTSSPGSGTHIRVIDWDLGTTEGGSSGAPLFSSQRRIIGQLEGGGAACGNNESDWFGRFSMSWTGNGTNATRLSNWLDPLGTSPTTLDTLVPGGSPVCGNNMTESGETCDDGNTISGDGCSSTCQIEVTGPANDNCANATSIGNGSFPFNTTNATTDGPAEPGLCTFFSDPTVSADVWFRYTATCTGTATASVCGSGYDTKMAVYNGTCPSSQSAIACNDDGCGGGGVLQSDLTFAAVAGNQYLIRIGGYTGTSGTATGTGTLTVFCTAGGCSNNTAATPLIIPSLPFNDIGSTAQCTNNYNEVCPFTPTGGRDLVYSYTPPGDQTINIDLCNSSFDTKVYIYANAVMPNSPIACNDDGCPTPPPLEYRSSLTGVALTGGTTYLIIIDGYSSVDFGTYNLSITGSTIVECTGPGDCDDGDPCTSNNCIANDCVFTPIDTDNDGTPDCTDGCPNDPNKTAPGICGCGISDADSDSDGTPNCNDGCPNDPNKTAPGICGCGVSDADSDNDGTPDCNDGCPNDINKLTPGVCGCGEPEIAPDGDLNEDGTTDGRDVQDMADGLVNGPTTAHNCHGDFNGNEVLDVGDVPGFVAALLAP